jgi:hypothetical protein
MNDQRELELMTSLAAQQATFEERGVPWEWRCTWSAHMSRTRRRLGRSLVPKPTRKDIFWWIVIFGLAVLASWVPA